MDFNKIKEAAQNYEADMTKKISQRDRKKIPRVRAVGKRITLNGSPKRCGNWILIKSRSIRKEMYSDIWEPERHSSDLMHILTPLVSETVTTGNFDPYEGFESDTEIGGRGTSDQLGGIVSAVYGARIMKDSGTFK